MKINSNLQDDGIITFPETILPVMDESVFTLRDKIEPLVIAQENLINDLSENIPDFSSISDAFSRANDTFTSISEPIQALGSSLSGINGIVTDFNLSLQTPVYDFINQPHLSLINAVTDSIKVNQEQLLSFVPNVQATLNQIIINSPNVINRISALDDIAVDYLGASLTLPIIENTSEKAEIEDLKKQIAKLNLRVNNLEDENRKARLTDITAYVSSKLEEYSPDLAGCFRGAMTTLIAGESEDFIGQVAESLTRVIEGLPFVINVGYKSVATGKKNQIKETLCDYLGLNNEGAEKHFLINQQASYYTVMSGVRHRKSNEYHIYSQNKNLFKALVIQVEAFIYTLVTYEKK